jgi:hypothetical protein
MWPRERAICHERQLNYHLSASSFVAVEQYQ